MRRSVLDIEFLTPCFLGGAEPKRSCEWRAASIRGQIRWWFRAVAGGHYRGDLEAVRKAEVRVFGDTSQASPLRIMALGEPRTASSGGRIPWRDPRLDAERLTRAWGMNPKDPDFAATVRRLQITSRDGTPVPSSPIQYLGYGCIGFRELERPCILPDQRVRCRLQWQDQDWKTLGSEIGKLFTTALWCWLHLGGIGAKSRKGFGSLACRGSQGELPAGGGDLLLVEPSLDNFEEGVRHVLEIGARAGDREPRWSHLSSRTKIFVAAELGSTWSDAMARIGGWLIAYRRRYGYSGDVRVRDGRGLRNRDYVWASPAADGGPAFRQGFPDRAGFGLPLPFEKKANRVLGETVNWRQGREESSKENRRASPLLIHIAKLGSGKYLPVITHIPARFLPEGAVLTYKRKDKTSPPNEAQVGIVDHFCDDLVAKKLLRQVKL